MDSIIYMAVSLLLIVISSALMYSYIVGRVNKQKNLKVFFSFSFDKQIIVLSLSALSIAIALFLYSFYFAEASFLKSFMNAEVTLWLSLLGYIDLKEKIIPNKLILVGISFWAILALVEIFAAKTSWKSVLQFSLIGAGVCGGVLLIIALIVKSALGMGDVKMFTVIGLLYGLTDTYSILLFSILIMAIVSIILLLAKKVTRKTAIPMAPFVVIGFVINVLLGM